MSDLISRSELLKYMENTELSQYIDEINNGNDNYNSTPFYDYVKEIPTAYDIGKVVEELEELEVKAITRYKNGDFGDFDGVDYYIKKSEAIEIVKHGGVADDVCEWKLEDEEANLYVTGCGQRHLIFEGTPKENGYTYCQYCSKKIKVVE